MLRPLGSPLPLGFFAFGVGSFLVALEAFGWIPRAEGRMVAFVALLFCAPLELGAALVAIATRDGAAAAILGIFGASWTIYGVSSLAFGPIAPPAATCSFNVVLAVVCLLIAAAALRSKPFFSTLLTAAAIRYGLVGSLALRPESHALGQACGWVGVVLGLAAFYGGEALLIEDTQGRTVLPLFRRADARSAIEGDLHAQLQQIEQEAGVRQQL